MRTTRTHTVYFGGEALAAAQAAHAELRDDWDARRPHIAEAVADAGDRRLDVLAAALDLLGEPVAESLT